MTDASPLDGLRADLADEVAAVAAAVDPLDDSDLRTPTPADGWDIADQLSHLAAFDGHATTAIVDPAGFRAELADVMDHGVDPIAAATARGRELGGTATRALWHAASAALSRAAGGLEPRQRLPWYGPDMGAMSFLTARLMETWAHGQDVRDALGLAPVATGRLRHVADIGVRARPFSYAVRSMELPSALVRVELTGPDGQWWTWGDDAAIDVVRGPALDFCLLVTQRRHRDDLSLAVEGPAARNWVLIAQAFAGAPGPGRARST